MSTQGKILIAIDIESDGPTPGTDLFSMISLGAVVVEPGLSRRFRADFAPISERYIEEALLVSLPGGRVAHEAMPDPRTSTESFHEWLKSISPEDGVLSLISDNPAFDWQFVNHYLIRFCDHNPLGHSARRIGDLYSGYKRDVRSGAHWRKLSVTPHTHDPLDDALGVAEALLAMESQGMVKGVSPKPRV